MCPWLSQTGRILKSNNYHTLNTLLCSCYLILTVELVYNLTEIKCHGVSKTLLLHQNAANSLTRVPTHNLELCII